MNRAVRGLRNTAPLAVLTALATMVGSPSASAAGSGVPFTDPNAHGTLTFCNPNGQPMTSGRLSTQPFAWKTVSSVAPPSGYGLPSSRATLYAYQPIQFIDPGDWSGLQITGASSFSNRAHPLVQATSGDATMRNFVASYPPHWDGLVQLRMYFTGFNKPLDLNKYPSAVLKITGNTWTLVQGGGASCTSGTGVSDETRLLPKSRFSSPPAEQTGASASPSSSTGAKGSAASSPGSSGSDGSTGSAAGNSDSQSGSGSSAGLSAGAKTGIGLGVLALVGAGVVAILLWRRRPAGGSAER
jgi:hypothetical protein